MEETRETGWYADPWGTEDERYFDGSAWTRRVRPPDGVPEATAVAEVIAQTPVLTSTPQTATVPPDASRAPPQAGWHPDPWGEATWRWSDGTRWTGYTDRSSSLSSSTVVAAELATERAWARWARIALTVNPVFQVLALIGASIQWRWIAGHWDDVANGANTSGPASATVFGYLGLPTLGVLVLLILWLYRAGATARAAGLPLRRDPGLGAVSFIIPILNFWWPYRAVRDTVGADPRAQSLVVRWWTLWVASGLGAFLVFAAAFLPEIFSIVAVGIVAVISVVAAFVGRAVVNAVLASHESLAAG
jgi:hypothetical protein